MRSLFIDNLWRWKVGLPEKDIFKKFDFDSLNKTEWNEEFETYMRNRLIFGAARYGLLHDINKIKYDVITHVYKRLKMYEKTRNRELLVDIANFMMIEFTNKKHFPFDVIHDIEHVSILKKL